MQKSDAGQNDSAVGNFTSAVGILLITALFIQIDDGNVKKVAETFFYNGGILLSVEGHFHSAEGIVISHEGNYLSHEGILLSLEEFILSRMGIFEDYFAIR
jgi:hypothetical protein